MKKNRKTFVALMVLTFITIVSTICIVIVYGMLAGWPWLKAKASQRVESYLKEHFVQEMQIESLNYDLFVKDYYAWVYPKNRSDLRFIVHLYTDGDIAHNYYEAYWSKQAEELVSKSLSAVSIYATKIYCQINTFPAPSFSPPYMCEEYNEYAPLYEKLPDYSEIKKLFTDKLNIFVDVSEEYLSSVDDEKLFEVLKQLREDTPFFRLSIEFSNAVFDVIRTTDSEGAEVLKNSLQYK